MKKATKCLLVFLAAFTLSMGAYAATTATVTVNWVVESSYDISLAMDSNCAQIYFVEGANPLTDTVVDGDENSMPPFDGAAGANRCQGPGDAAFVVTNNGTATADLNAVFDSVTAGVFNKIFLADDATFCGADGNAGYEAECTGFATPTTCADLNATLDTNIFYDLGSGGNVGFCLNADFFNVAAGSTSGTLTITSGSIG